MSNRMKTGLFLAAILFLTFIPLLIVKVPVTGADGREAAIFTGSDSQAKGAIQRIAPGYQPWVLPLLNPPSAEIESLLFALQAALGAGVIGYYAGYVRGKRARMPAPDVGDRAH